MRRPLREKAYSGYYHVMLRGNGLQILFEDDEDREAFVSLLASVTSKRGLSVIAWVLMSDHVHVVVHDPEDRISEAMCVLCTSYARRYNKVNGHVGHVFEGRFEAVPIEDDTYLLEVVRYVHNNPAKAGICAAREYQWSSYGEYVGTPVITDTAMVLEMHDGVDNFVAYGNAEGASELPPRLSCRRRTDDEALEVARYVLMGLSPADLKSLDRERRDELLCDLRRVGLSVRQIQRLTGIGKYTITKATTYWPSDAGQKTPGVN